MERRKKFVIIGAGIGGLCAAIALQRSGMEAVVYEKTPSIRPVGAGLALGANAMKGLERLGIAQSVLNAGKRLEALAILDSKGRTVSVTDSTLVEKRYGIDNVAIQRSALHEIFVERLQERTLYLHKRCVAFEDRADGAAVKFEDGTTAEGDYVVAADGIHSTFRRALVPQSQIRYAGYTCWRAVIDRSGLSLDPRIATETWGPKGRFGVVPLANDKLYWFATAKAPAGDRAAAQAGIKEIAARFGGYHDPIPAVLAATPAESVIHNDISDIAPLKRLAFGRILLLGDAAHAATPNLGQGAGQAVEDAVALMHCVRTAASIPEAFQAYEKLRLNRTSEIIRMSRRVGMVAQIENAVLGSLRNALLRKESESARLKRLAFLYDVDLGETTVE